MTEVFRAAQLFDGAAMHAGAALVVRDGRVAAVLRAGAAAPDGARLHDLGAGMLVPGFLDLQVNGGGGAMVGAGTDAEALGALCALHGRLGATGILPTLISDRPETTLRVIEAGIAAARSGAPGFLGLHLEGPHLDPRRAGAHDPVLLRPMAEDDLRLYERAAAALPALMLTLAPEAASPAQIARLTQAGVVVSLGHSGCDEAAARAAFAAGARAVTHLFNAMAPVSARAPGLAGAALDAPAACGIIADGVHVADSLLRLGLAAKPQDGLFLVSDSMAVAGCDAQEFLLNGRSIRRAGGRLSLADGTLAGADLTLPAAVAHMVAAGAPASRALAMASAVPADVIGALDRGGLRPGSRADFLYLDAAFALRGAWRDGRPLSVVAGQSMA